MAEMTVQEMTQRLSDLMAKNAGVRGQSFAGQFRKAPRVFKRAQRQLARTLIEADARAANPKLARQVDHQAMAKAFRVLEAHLETLDPAERFKGRVLGWAGGLVINLILLVVGAVIAWVVLQRGG